MLDSLLVRTTTVFVPCPSNTVSDHDKYIIQFLGLQMLSYKMVKMLFIKSQGFYLFVFLVNLTSGTDSELGALNLPSILNQLSFNVFNLFIYP